MDCEGAPCLPTLDYGQSLPVLGCDACAGGLRTSLLASTSCCLWGSTLVHTGGSNGSFVPSPSPHHTTQSHPHQCCGFSDISWRWLGLGGSRVVTVLPPRLCSLTSPGTSTVSSLCSTGHFPPACSASWRTSGLGAVHSDCRQTTPALCPLGRWY